MKLSTAAREIVSISRRHRLTYDGLRKAIYQARRHLHMKPPRGGRQLPHLLTESQLKAFFSSIDSAGDIQHQIMLRLLFYTAIRVSDLVNIRVSDVDLSECKIFIESGKGDKDRYILFPEQFKLTIQSHLRASSGNEYLFESNRRYKYSTRQIQRIVEDYAEACDLKVHPHLLRHQMLTYLTKSGLKDSAIQLISGHANKKSLEVYQHLSLQDVQEDYQEAMKKVSI